MRAMTSIFCPYVQNIRTLTICHKFSCMHPLNRRLQTRYLTRIDCKEPWRCCEAGMGTDRARVSGPCAPAPDEDEARLAVSRTGRAVTSNELFDPETRNIPPAKPV